MTEDLLQRGRVNHTADAHARPSHLNLDRAGGRSRFAICHRRHRRPAIVWGPLHRRAWRCRSRLVHHPDRHECPHTTCTALARLVTPIPPADFGSCHDGAPHPQPSPQAGNSQPGSWPSPPPSTVAGAPPRLSARSAGIRRLDDGPDDCLDERHQASLPTLPHLRATSHRAEIRSSPAIVIGCETRSGYYHSTSQP